MSGYTSAPRFSRPAAVSGGVRPRVLARARAFWARLMLMRRAAETRRELGTLNSRLLSDIGVSRAEASREAERWPWDLGPDRFPGRGTSAHR
jgi:uncharacterized protein YjiS (DUF1127 family)